MPVYYITNKQEIEVLPCPFCGAELSDLDFSDFSKSGGGTAVYCKKCSGRGPIVDGYKGDAVLKWNTRVYYDQLKS